MVSLCINHRTLPAYRQSFLVDENTWITTRTPFYYLDLAVPNEILFNMHFKKIFPDNKVENGIISKFDVSRNQRFHLDDTSVGCKGRKDSNLFYTYAMATDRKVDKIGMRLFLDFLDCIDNGDDDAPSLTSGEKAVQFIKLATLIGYQQWREIVIPSGPDMPRELLVDNIFSFVNPSLLKGVYEKKSEDPLLVKELWDLFCITDETQLMLFMEVPDFEHLKFMLEVANRIKFDFWGMKHGGKGLTEHIFIHYVKEKRLDLITLMLDYGFALGEMDPENIEKHECTIESPLTDSFFDYTSEKFVHNATILRFFVRCYESYRELPVFIVVFQKVSRTLRLPSLPPSYVLKHLTDALGIDPLEFPQNTWPKKWLKDAEEELEKMAAMYEACDLHPSDSSVVAPQTLSQLSRCVIRDRLAANHQLIPTAVGDSHLPTLIKNILNLLF